MPNIKYFATMIESSVYDQIKQIVSLDVYKDSKIRIMPDCHSGKGCVIGTTMTINEAITPNFVGVDIGCGVLAYNIGKPIKDLDLKEIDEFIHNHIPSGKNVNDKEGKLDFLNDLHCKDFIKLSRVRKSIGTLGGGNHFIEINKDSEGNIYLVVHSGSRYLGKQVAEYYQNVAFATLYQDNQEKIAKIIKEAKEKFEFFAINDSIEEVKKQRVHKNMAYVYGDNLNYYLEDMKITQYYAKLNRERMLNKIMNFLFNKKYINSVTPKDIIHSVHNYIDVENKILRKGAISAQKGEKVIIPINMRDGSIIAIGKGNPDYNYSAPHGAGRLMGRRQAKRSLSLEVFKETMKDIYSTCVNKDTLDESPMAYKSLEDILPMIEPTAEVVKIIKPIYNFKGV